MHLLVAAVLAAEGGVPLVHEDVAVALQRLGADEGADKPWNRGAADHGGSHGGSHAEAEPGDSKTRLWQQPIEGDSANGQLRRGLGSGRQRRLGMDRWLALWRPFGNFRNEAGDLMPRRRRL